MSQTESGSDTDGDDPKRLSPKFTSEKFCPKTFSAKRNVRFAGIMSDNSDQKILDEPEFESIRHQAMAFERMFDMSANLSHMSIMFSTFQNV